MPTDYNAYQEVSLAKRDTIWKTAFFVLDTNILLQLFDVTAQTANQQFEALDAIKDRLWFPHQVVHEFLLHQGERAYARVKLAKSAVDSFKGFQNAFNAQSLKMTTATETKKALAEKLKTFIESCGTDLDKLVSDSKLHVEEVSQKINTYLETCSGRRPTLAELNQRTLDIEARFRLHRGPGHRDIAKDGYARWMGDTLIWLEVIEHAKSIGKPLILCTNDGKDDWWHHGLNFDGSEVVMPQPHLAEEVEERCGQAMLMYRSSEFYSELRNRKLSRSAATRSVKKELDAAFYRSTEDDDALISYFEKTVSNEAFQRQNPFLRDLAAFNQTQSPFLAELAKLNQTSPTKSVFEHALLRDYARSQLNRYNATPVDGEASEPGDPESNT